jgi:hypothetical protein
VDGPTDKHNNNHAAVQWKSWISLIMTITFARGKPVLRPAIPLEITLNYKVKKHPISLPEYLPAATAAKISKIEMGSSAMDTSQLNPY